MVVSQEPRRKAYTRTSHEKRREIFRLVPIGLGPREIAEQAGVSRTLVDSLLKPLGGVIRKELYKPSAARLSLEQRVEIRIGLERGLSFRAIATAIGRNVSTVSREVKANGGRDGYRPTTAHERAAERAKRPKATKLASNPTLCEQIARWLKLNWSPQQISHRLRLDFSDDQSMQISHETIYKSLFVQARGELNRELARHLRTQRIKRKTRGRTDNRGRIPDMISISQRPAEADDRAVPGHWEGDLIIGKGNKSAVGTLVERTTRFTMLLHLPNGHNAEAVRIAMQNAIQTLPDAIRRSITWDQGKELSQHAQFTIDTGIPIYFCDPHSPWQRGTNENTNGLLRQYMPKGTDLSLLTLDDLNHIADELNGRPRQTLDWLKPSEKLDQMLTVATTN